MKVFLHFYAIVAIFLKRFQTMNSQLHVALLLHDSLFPAKSNLVNFEFPETLATDSESSGHEWRFRKWGQQFCIKEF